MGKHLQRPDRRVRRRARAAALIGAAALISAGALAQAPAASAGILPSTTTLSVSPATSFVGTPVTMTSSVSLLGLPGLGVTPTGTVTFRYDSGTNHIVIGTNALATCLLTTCTVSRTTSSLPVGAGVITATYSGDTVLLGSSKTAGVTVNYQPEPTPTSSTSQNCGAGSPCASQQLVATQGSNTDKLTVTGDASSSAQTVTASLTNGATLDCPLPVGDTATNAALATFDSTATDVGKTVVYRVEGPDATTLDNNYGNHTSFMGCYASPTPFNGYSPTGLYGPAPAYTTPYGVFYEAYLNNCSNNSGAKPCFVFTNGLAAIPAYVSLTVNTPNGDPKLHP